MRILEVEIVRRDLMWELRQALDSLPQSVREILASPLRDGLAVLLMAVTALLSVDNILLVALALLASLGDMCVGAMYAWTQGFDETPSDFERRACPPGDPGRRVRKFQPAVMRAGALKKIIVFTGVPLGGLLDVFIWRVGGVQEMLIYTPVMKFALCAYTLAELASWARIIARAGGPRHLVAQVLRASIGKATRAVKDAAGVEEEE